MSRFVYPDWQLPPDHHRPPRPAPLDPELRSEYDTRIEETLNRFIEAQHGALYTDDDAFLRRKGRDAVDGARRMTDRLAALKDEMIAGAASDYERRALEERLAPVLDLVQQDIGRHAADQKKVWQREVMDRRMELMRKQAGLRWNDPDALEAYAEAAESAARDRAWIDGLAPDTEELQPNVTAARSAVLRSAIEGALAGGDSEAAHALHQNAAHRLSPEDTDALARQFEAWHARERGDDLAVNLPSAVSQADGSPQAMQPLPDVPTQLSAEEMELLIKLLRPDAPRSHSADAAVKTVSEVTSDTPQEERQIAQLPPPATGDTKPSDQSREQSGRGTPLPTEPPSNSTELEKDFEQWEGRVVRLPDGSPVPDPHSPTGFLMSPFEDLKEVAAAGKEIGRQARTLLGISETAAFYYLRDGLKHYLAQGGTFDYQRRRYAPGKDGFTQLRQFRNVSNFNVGLLCQQAGLGLWGTLELAGRYARANSQNARPDQPHGLDPQTRYFIELGYQIGEAGAFEERRPSPP